MSQHAAVGAVVYAKNVARLSAFYSRICDLQLTHSETDHVVLASPAFQLVILAIPAGIAESITLTSPPTRREDTPIKLVFHVESIDAVRKLAADLGGELNPREREWFFQGGRVCDGHDPEGNVVQFREKAR
ncbi:MAG TPA: VOC family protein [Arenimonas sp.]|uniref:VOC family protein n=1 Tax=Arenimonas sp. TaxID=1872635 RepID=UPI002C1D3290|nr:VOC family protein [Arenimonas sp.]HMB56785.1 VOC family protein [Arenimonas sp.]